MVYLTSQQHTPLLIFDGNCQAHHLAAIFKGSGLAEAYCIGEDYGFVPTYQGATTSYCAPDEAMAYIEQAKVRGRAAYQVSQSTQMQAAADTTYRPLVDAVIKFPFLQYYCIAPQAFEDTYQRKLPPQRVLDFDLSLMRLCQAKAESVTDFAAYVQDAGQRTMLFNTESHPRGVLMSLLFLQIARAIPSLDAQNIEDVAARLEFEEGINHVTAHPVSDDILDALGFDWGETYDALRETLIASSRRNWLEVVHLASGASNLWNDSQLLSALGRAYLELRDLNNKGHVYRRLTELSSGYIHSWLLRSQYWQLLGNEEELRKCRRDMRVALRHNRYYSQTRAWMGIQNGDLDRALAYGLDYLQRTPDRADGVVPYVKALSLMGRSTEAKEVFYQFACDRGEGDLVNVLAQLPNLKELEIDAADVRRKVISAVSSI